MTAGARLDAALRRAFGRGSICGGDPEHPLKLLVEQLDHLSDAELRQLAYPEGQPLDFPHQQHTD